MANGPNAFGNTNPNQFANLNFNNWSEVVDMFGPSVVQALQQNNVPLDQVGSTIGKLGIAQQTGQQQYGAANPQFVSSGFTLADAINMQQGQGGFQQPQQSGFNPATSPNFDTSLIGAQALNAVGLNPSHTVTINPTPANTPSSGEFAKSGVSAVASPEQMSIQGMPYPSTSVPSVFTQARGLNDRQFYSKPTTPWMGAPTPTPQPTGAQATPPVPFGKPPTIPQTQMPQIGGQMPPIANVPPAPTGPISGLSGQQTPPGAPMLPAGIQNYAAGANAPGLNATGMNAAGIPAVTKRMARGGEVNAPGNTDTVPAMLTPGEYVINRGAAQQIGRQQLDQLNREGNNRMGAGLFDAPPMHMQGGGMVPFSEGSIPGASPSPSFSPSSDAQSWAFSQLNPQEQATLQGGGSAGQQIQQKFNALAQNYMSQSGAPTPMSSQLGMAQKLPPTATQIPVRGGMNTAPAAPQGQPGQQTTGQFGGNLDQWLAQYGHTPQGQSYIAQNGNVAEVQRYLQNLTGQQPQSQPQQPQTNAPMAQYAGPPAGYGAAPRGQLVGLPAGQGPQYDPRSYGVTPQQSPAVGAIQSGLGSIGQIGQNMISGAEKALGSIQPARNAIPNPEDFKRQTPDVVLQGHQVGQPNVAGGYVMLAQPHDQGFRQPNDQQGQGPYDANNFG